MNILLCRGSSYGACVQEFVMKTNALTFFLTLLGGTAAWAQAPFVFRDAGDEAGLFPAVAKIAGHGVGWGDVDGDGWPDLYVGAFGGHPYDSKTNQLFRNDKGKFRLDDQPHLR